MGVCGIISKPVSVMCSTQIKIVKSKVLGQPMELWGLYTLIIILEEIYYFLYVTFHLFNIYVKQVGMKFHYSAFIEALYTALNTF